MKNVLLTTILAAFCFFATPAADDPPLLEKCWQFFAEYNPKIGIASDNDSAIYLPIIDGTLTSLSETGIVRWKTETGGTLISNLLHFDKVLFFVVRTNDPKSPAIVRAVSSATGVTRWQSAVELEEDDDLRVIRIFGRQLLITERTGRRHIVTPYESLLRETVSPTREVTEAEVTSLSIKADEAAGQGNVIHLDNGDRLVSDRAGRLDYLTCSGINKSWSARIGGDILSISESQAFIYISSADNYLYAFRRADGRMTWRRRFESRIESAFDEEKNVLVSSFINGQKTAVTDATTGQLVNVVILDSDRYFAGAPRIIGSKVILLQNDSLAAYQFGSCSK